MGYARSLLDKMLSQVDEWPSLKDSPEYQKQLTARVEKVKKDDEYSKHLTKENDVLKVLDFPDNKEEAFREILEKQAPQILKELATKSKAEILNFLIQEKNNQFKNEVIKTTEEVQQQKIKNESVNEQYQERDEKYNKIKNILPEWVYNWNPKFKTLVSNLEKFEAIKTWNDTDENIAINNDKTEILEAIITELKNPKVLKSTVELLWWADKNNPKYLEFKNTLIGIDSTFERDFYNLENANFEINSSTNEVVNLIEKDSWWIIDIDLNTDKPMSKMSLTWSDYSFDKEIDKQALTDIQEENINKLTGIQNSEAVLKGLYNPFNKFINQIKQSWEQDLKKTIKGAISNFSQDVLNGLDEDYETLGIESSMQLSEADITSFSTIDTASDLQQHIDRITAKFKNIEVQAWKMKTWVLKNHQIQMKELLEIESKQKEKQLKVLEYMKRSGFDLIPKEVTNRIIRELQSNTLIIPWLDLSVKNIDLKNWNFWESWAFTNKEAWINIASKTNMVKFVNKIISWNVNEPLSVKAIANWISVANPALLKGKFLEADIVGGMGWKYS